MSPVPQADAKKEAYGFGLSADDVLPIVLLLAAVASGMSGQEPTGNIGADFVLAAGFGAGLVWLSRYASPDALVISAVLALFFSGLQFPAVLIGAAAVAGALFMTTWRRFDRDSWRIGAAISAAFTSQAALNLPNIRFVGSASILATIAAAPIVVTAVRALPSRYRTWAIRGLIGAAIFALVSSALAAYAGLSVRDHVEVGIEQAQDGVAALEAGDQPEARRLLEAAQANFDIASDRLGGPLTWPARIVPVVAQHSRAIETASDQGSALARTAVRTVTSADVDQIRGQSGAIDLDVVRAVNGELTTANAVLQQAQSSLLDVRTAWLLPALDDRLESVQVELAATTEDIDLANQATALLPQILGADDPRRYLVLFVQPSESREYGGFVGAYAMLEADQGRLSLGESGSITDLVTIPATFTEPADFPRAYRRLFPEQNPQNLTGIADLTTIAEAARDFVPQWRRDTGYTIDGVLTIDPFALAGLLELTGPITIPDRPEPITADNVVNFLLRDQYFEFDDLGRDQRQDVLNVLAGATFDRLLDVEIPGPERLGAIFGPIARANRLAFRTFDDQENVFLDRVLLSADFPDIGEAVEILGVYGATATASKLDAYTSRSMTYEVEINPATGEVTGRVDVAITNDAPADAPEYVTGLESASVSIGDGLELGENLLALSIYSRSQITAVTSPDAVFRADEPTESLGYDRHVALIEVPRAETRHVTFDTTSQVLPGRYDLLVTAQPVAVVGNLTLIVRPTTGWRVVSNDVAADGSWSTTVPMDLSRGFTVEFARS